MGGNKMTKAVVMRFDTETVERFVKLAKLTGQTKSYYIDVLLRTCTFLLF